jgi:precorrin-6B methylase 2
MRPDDFLQIEKTLERRWNSPTTTHLLVELGSGHGSVFLSKLMTRLGGRIISIEHDEKWYWKTHKLFAKHNCHNYALHWIPARDCGDFSFDTDKLHTVLDGQHIDILLVDNGPGARERRPALEILWRHLQPDALVFLHDTKRDGEAQIVKDWSRVFSRTTSYDTELGLTVFER